MEKRESSFGYDTSHRLHLSNNYAVFPGVFFLCKNQKIFLIQNEGGIGFYLSKLQRSRLSFCKLLSVICLKAGYWHE